MHPKSIASEIAIIRWCHSLRIIAKCYFHLKLDLSERQGRRRTATHCGLGLGLVALLAVPTARLHKKALAGYWKPARPMAAHRHGPVRAQPCLAAWQRPGRLGTARPYLGVPRPSWAATSLHRCGHVYAPTPRLLPAGLAYPVEALEKASAGCARAAAPLRRDARARD